MKIKKDKPVSLAPLTPEAAIRGALEIDPKAWEQYRKELAEKKSKRAKPKRKKKGPAK